MKKNYTSAQMDIIELDLVDIVTNSDEIKVLKNNSRVLPNRYSAFDYSTNDPGFLKYYYPDK